MERTVIATKDGSLTIAIPEMNVTYHSVHGAIQESLHVFIEAGLRYVSAAMKVPGTIRIFEMGLGTGLNALLTLMETEKIKHRVHYTAIEPFPPGKEQIKSLNYCEQLSRKDLQPPFEQLHESEWEKEIAVTNYFIFQKSGTSLLNPLNFKPLNLIYFDAFAPSAQPELWTKEVFEKLHNMLLPGGILVTYCSKGDVRRAMQAAGFGVEKIPGPPGKREMIRAKKK